MSGVHRRGGEFIESELQDAATRDDLVERAVAEMIQRGEGRRAWLVFCCGVRHAELVRDELRKRDISADMVVGETPADERAQIIDEFRAGRIKALTNCQVLTTGFDAPNVDLLALLRPTLSTGLYVQMVGRGTRLCEGKPDCMVLDFAGNIMRHGPVDAVDPHRKKAGGEGKGEMLAKLCPQCDAIVPLAAATCEDCGYTFPVKIVHEEKPAEAAILSTDRMWTQVENVYFRRHINCEGRASFRVDYQISGKRISDWLSFEGSPGARFHAERKWRKFGGQEPIPADAVEALKRITELRRITGVITAADGNFMRIVDVRTEAKVAA